MARREILEGFRTASILKIDKQDLFDEGLQHFKRNCLENLATHRLPFSETATDADVVSFASVSRFDPEEADIANVVLGAGVGASGKVNVHGHIQLKAMFEMLDEFQRVSFRAG